MCILFAGAGTTDGAPVVVYDASTQSGGGVVLSTLDEHFTAQVTLGQNGFAGGLTTQVHQVPAGYATSFLLHAAAPGPTTGGVTNLVIGWGTKLQSFYADDSKARQELAAVDEVTTKLGWVFVCVCVCLCVCVCVFFNLCERFLKPCE